MSHGCTADSTEISWPAQLEAYLFLIEVLRGSGGDRQDHGGDY